MLKEAYHGLLWSGCYLMEFLFCRCGYIVIDSNILERWLILDVTFYLDKKKLTQIYVIDDLMHTSELKIFKTEINLATFF